MISLICGILKKKKKNLTDTEIDPWLPEVDKEMEEMVSIYQIENSKKNITDLTLHTSLWRKDFHLFLFSIIQLTLNMHMYKMLLPIL